MIKLNLPTGTELGKNEDDLTKVRRFPMDHELAKTETKQLNTLVWQVLIPRSGQLPELALEGSRASSGSFQS